ncbi:MAG: N-acyl-D-amino-acid deacylase family protein [Pseudomonadota bacterium]
MIDILIKNGSIVDGTGSAAFEADIAISNGKISAIGRSIFCEAGEVIDASGLVVAPGFIDVHSHNDLVPFMEERVRNLKLMQGVTTELVGQCGLGVVPCVEAENPVWKNYIRGVVGDPGISWEFYDLDKYFTDINVKELKNNFASLISHGAVRTRVMGFDSRTPDGKELRSMCRIVSDAMESGAFGMSLGLQYMPAIFSSREELVDICKVVKGYGGIVMVHLRNHDSSMVEALEEIAAVAEASKVKLHISHMRSYNSAELGCKAEILLEFVDIARRRDIDITFDEHLYLSGSTLMTQLLPPWLTEKGSESLLCSLKCKEVLERVKEELSDTRIRYKGWDNYSAIKGWDGILITSVKTDGNKAYIGKTVGEIARSLGIHPVDLVSGLLVEEQTGVGIVTLGVFSEEDTIKLIQHPLQMVGSDSIPAGVPHPRLYGNYPLFIGKFVREKKALSLEAAIRKCTLLPAETLGIKGLGQLKAGYAADITIFDFNKINGYEDYSNSTLPPIGIRDVVLGGKLAVKDGVPCVESHGRVIVHNKPICNAP